VSEILVGSARRWPTLQSTPVLTLVAIAAVLFWTIIAVFAPVIAPHDPVALGTVPLSPPGPEHWFGTDELGRDTLSRLMWGARVTIPYSVITIAISVAIGVIFGGVAGYFGGWIDEVIMRVTDFVFAFPTIVLAMALTAALGPGLKNAVLAIALVNWPSYARVVRSLVISTVHSDFVLSARLLGTSSVGAMVVDVLPNVAGPMVVFTTLGLGSAMLFLTGLSFLGLGSQPPAAEWGSMISDAFQYATTGWWLALFPGLAIVSAVLAINILGESLRDRWDPRATSS
jgi:peptide/nickel transport system permease protein